MSSTIRSEFETLKSELDSLASKSTSVITRWEWKRCFQESLSKTLRLGFLFPLLAWGIHYGGNLLGFLNGNLTILAFGGWTLFSAVAFYLINAVVKGLTIQVNRSQALTFADQQLNSKDRLLSADQFLNETGTNRFKQAAILDAKEIAGQAKKQSFQIEAQQRKWAMAEWTGPGLALIAFALLMLLGPGHFRNQETPSPADRVSLKTKLPDTSDNQSKKEEKKAERNPAETKAPPKEEKGKSNSTKNKENRSNKKSPSTERSESFQKVGGNQSSQSNTSANSNGTGSNPQPQNGKSKEKKKDQKNPKQIRKPSGKKKPSAKRKPNPQKPAGVMAGKGTGKAANAENEDLPSFPKAAKANSNPEDDGDDGDTDDEDEQQKSETGNKPTLNNKKPAPSREAGGISPPPGDQQSKSKKPPQRGGRSGVKKSRGVPSAILGVPTPDRLTGTPNASRFKIKQEESSPQEENASKINASARQSRQGLVGDIPNLKIPLWQQRIVEKYFQKKKTSNQTNQSNQ